MFITENEFQSTFKYGNPHFSDDHKNHKRGSTFNVQQDFCMTTSNGRNRSLVGVDYLNIQTKLPDFNGWTEPIVSDRHESIKIESVQTKLYDFNNRMRPIESHINSFNDPFLKSPLQTKLVDFNNSGSWNKW